MIVLGVSGGHDANWCVVKDGVILGAFEKERFTRVRHAKGEVVSLVPRTLAYLGVSPSEIDLVATSEPVHRNTEPGLRFLDGAKYRTVGEWTRRSVECLGRVLPCVSVPHHLSHASYARYTSGFDEPAVLTWDGGGDFHTEDAYASTTVSVWKGPELEWIERVDNADFGSLWFLYSRAIFGNENAAGKLMGLAATGTDALVEAMTDRFVVPVQGTFQGAWAVRNCWPEYHWPPFLRGRTVTWEDELARNIAAGVQAITRSAGLSIAKRVREVTGRRDLALCGGVALNGYLNTAVRAEAGFDDVYVPPAVHDGGLSVGAALFATHHVSGVPWQPVRTTDLAFLGMHYAVDEIALALEDAGFAHERVELDEAIRRAASDLVDGRVVAWFEGRSEHGPRALGHRSLLALPASVSIKDHLNRDIKFREPFRPLAPVVLEEDTGIYLDRAWRCPYMLEILPVSDKMRREAPAAVHDDGTARVQTVAATATLGRIVEAVRRSSGLGIVLNTSLNVKEPIVETPGEALSILKKVPVDRMFLDGFWIENPR